MGKVKVIKIRDALRARCSGEFDILCLICNKTCNSKSPSMITVNSDESNNFNIEFVLKHLFDLPFEHFESYKGQCQLQGKWLKICSDCRKNYVEKCRRIYSLLVEVQTSFEASKRPVFEAIKNSIDKKAASNDVKTGIGGAGGIIKSIHEEIRRFVIERECADSIGDLDVDSVPVSEEKLVAPVNVEENPMSAEIPCSTRPSSTKNEAAVNLCENEIQVKEEPNSPLNGTTFEDHGSTDGEGGPPYMEGELKKEVSNRDNNSDGEGGDCGNSNEDQDWNDNNSSENTTEEEDKSNEDEDIQEIDEKQECRICQKKLSANYLQAHILKFHEKKNFHCKLCGQGFILEKKFLRHSAAHEDGTYPVAFICPFEGCGKSYKKNCLLREHQRYHKPPDLKCPQCPKLYCTKRDLQRHVELHRTKQTRPARCKLCPARFPNKLYLLTHVKRVHNSTRQPKPKPINRIHKPKELLHCEICKVQFQLKSKLLFHMSSVHGEKTQARYSCLVEGCEKSFRLNSQLTAHSKYHKSREFQCHLCPKLFRDQKWLGKHVAQHQIRKENPFLCEMCPRRFVTQLSLSKHIQRIHKTSSTETSTICSICKKVFATTQKLKGHVQFVHERKYQVCCDLCGKVLMKKASLQSHLSMVHGVENGSKKLPSFWCTKEGCKRKFGSGETLKQHLSLHDTKKEKKCHFCEKVFFCGSLQRHVVNVHGAGDKPFKCEVCTKEFTFNAYLRKHTMKVHGMKA